MLLQRSTQTSTSPFTRESLLTNQLTARCVPCIKGDGHLSRSTAKGRSRSRSNIQVSAFHQSFFLSRKEPNDKLPGIITWLPSARWVVIAPTQGTAQPAPGLSQFRLRLQSCTSTNGAGMLHSRGLFSFFFSLPLAWPDLDCQLVVALLILHRGFDQQTD